MAHLFSDGFPYGTAQIPNRWTDAYSCTIETANPRFSGGRWLSMPNGGWVLKTFNFLSTVILQFGQKTLSYGGSYWNDRIVNFTHYGNTSLLLINYNGTLQLYNKDQQLLATGTIPMAGTGTWQQLEVKIVVHSSNGSCLVKINGATAINTTGINTDPFGDQKITDIQLGGSGGFAQGISDIILMDTSGSYMNDLLGPRQVLPCMPTANGNYAQWTPSSGSNWQCIDEIPPNDSDGLGDRNVSSTVGNKDTFVVPDISAGATIDAVVVDMFAKTATPGAASLKATCRSNGDDGDGTEVTVPGSYAYIQSAIYVDPDTNAPFTASAFNSAEFGYKRSA